MVSSNLGEWLNQLPDLENHVVMTQEQALSCQGRSA